MIVDRVARAMTEGAPRPGFTERVMAPIHGRPRPGFTTRVMAQLDAPERRASAAWRHVALATLSAALVAGAAWSVALQPGMLNREGFPGMPPAPAVTPRPYLRAAIDVPPLPLDRWLPAARPAIARADRAGVATAAVTLREAEGHYVIAPLPGPSTLIVTAIDRATPDIPALAARPLAPPPPLALRDISFEKETP